MGSGGRLEKTYRDTDEKYMFAMANTIPKSLTTADFDGAFCLKSQSMVGKTHMLTLKMK